MHADLIIIMSLSTKGLDMDNTIQKTVNVLAQLAPSSGGSGASKSFQQLVRSIGEAKTKHEEDRIMKREATILKEKLGSRDTNTVGPLLLTQCVHVHVYIGHVS